MSDDHDHLDDGDHAERPNPHTHTTRLPPDSRGKLNFIVENLRTGVTPMTMIFDDREVEVIAYGIEVDDEYLYQPVAIFVDPDLEARLSHLPEPELPPEVTIPDGFVPITLPDGRVGYVPPST